MDVLDFILNLAGLLLWMSWQAIGVSSLPQPRSVSILSTLKPAQPVPPKRWAPLGVLLLLLFARSLLYWQVGRPMHWMAQTPLAAVTLAFPSRYWTGMLVFSFVSFGWMLAHYYLWLLLLSLLNRSSRESNRVQQLVRLQLGPLRRWPPLVLWLVPFVFGAVVWATLSTPLTRWAAYSPVPTPETYWYQVGVVGLATYVAWKYLLVGLLVAHIINSYVYVGPSPHWHYLAEAGQNLLRPLRWLPLKLGRFDLAPLLGVAAALAAAHYAESGLAWLFQHPPM